MRLDRLCPYIIIIIIIIIIYQCLHAETWRLIWQMWISVKQRVGCFNVLLTVISPWFFAILSAISKIVLFCLFNLNRAFIICPFRKENILKWDISQNSCRKLGVTVFKGAISSRSDNKKHCLVLLRAVKTTVKTSKNASVCTFGSTIKTVSWLVLTIIATCPRDQRDTQACYPFISIFYFCQVTPLKNTVLHIYRGLDFQLVMESASSSKMNPVTENYWLMYAAATVIWLSCGVLFPVTELI